MPFKRHILFVLPILLAGCNTPPVVQSVDQDRLSQAKFDVANAIAANAEWLVSNPDDPQQSVTLSQLLQHASEKQEQGDTEAAMRLASIVSEYARLGLAQANDQLDAKPVFQLD